MFVVLPMKCNICNIIIIINLKGVDWKYGNEDGGLESIGVVLKVNANGLIIVRCFVFSIKHS